MKTSKTKLDKFLNFLENRGFYIILCLCLAAIGVSGYVLFFTDDPAPASSTEPIEYLYNLEEDLPEIPAENDFELVLPDDAPVSGAEKPEPDTSAAKPQEIPAETAPSETPKKTPETPTKPKNEKVSFVRPLSGELVQAFSRDELVYNQTMADWRVHAGADYASVEGGRVCSIADGTIDSVFTDDVLGFCVEIDHGGGYKSLYAGLMQTETVKEGMSVKAGDVIGGVGNTMLTECGLDPHLHLEVTKDGVKIDPESVIPQKK